MSESAPQPNPIGRASLWLGILSSSLVFGIGLCALTGLQQGWIAIAGTPLFVCGGASAFLGIIAFFLGVGGLFGKHTSKAVAIAGALLGALGACLFILILNGLGG